MCASDDVSSGCHIVAVCILWRGTRAFSHVGLKCKPYTGIGYAIGILGGDIWAFHTLCFGLSAVLADAEHEARYCLPYLSRVSYGTYGPYTEGLFKIFDVGFLTRLTFLWEESRVMRYACVHGALSSKTPDLSSSPGDV